MLSIKACPTVDHAIQYFLYIIVVIGTRYGRMAKKKPFFGKVNLPTWISVPSGVQIKEKTFLSFFSEFYGPLHDPLYFPL